MRKSTRSTDTEMSTPVKTEYQDTSYTADYLPAAPTPELKPGMYVNHVATPGIAATVVAVNRGFALVEMMDAPVCCLRAFPWADWPDPLEPAQQPELDQRGPSVPILPQS